MNSESEIGAKNGKIGRRNRKWRKQKSLSCIESGYINHIISSYSSDESFLSSFKEGEEDFADVSSSGSGKKSYQSLGSDRSRKINSLNEKKSRRKRAKQTKSNSDSEFGKITALLAENHTIDKKQAEYLSNNCLGLLKNLGKVSSFSKIVSCLHQGTMSNLYIVTLDENRHENEPKFAVLKIFHKDLKMKSEIEEIKKANFPLKYTSKKDAEFWAENESKMIKILNKNPGNGLKCAKVLTRFHNALLLTLFCNYDEHHQRNQVENDKNSDERNEKNLTSAPRLINACKNPEFADKKGETLRKLVHEAISYLVLELSLFTPTLSAYSLLLDNTTSLCIVDLSRARLINGDLADKLKISDEMESKILMQVCH